MVKKLYGDRDIVYLDYLNNYYSKHVSAMTSESLHSKSDIAAELAWRDLRIDLLQTQLENKEHGAIQK